MANGDSASCAAGGGRPSTGSSGKPETDGYATSPQSALDPEPGPAAKGFAPNATIEDPELGTRTVVKASAARALGREAPRPDGSQLSDRYQLIERTGATAGGQAYTGKDNALDRPVAVKVLSSARALDPIRRQRFFHEARIAAQLRHPNKPADLRPRPDPGRRNRLYHRAAGGQPLDVALRTVSWGKNAKRGHVRNVRFDQINLPDGIKPCIRIEGSERENQIDQVRFSGLRLNVQGLNDTVSAEVGFNIFTTAVSFRE